MKTRVLRMLRRFPNVPSLRVWPGRLSRLPPWIGLAVLATGAAGRTDAAAAPGSPPSSPDPQAQFEVLDRARLTVALIFAGLVGLLGVHINWRRVSALERQVATAQLGQITERFTRAIDQLGAVRPDNTPAPEIRAGGLRSLERIAGESPGDFWPILDILSAYLRSAEPCPTRGRRLLSRGAIGRAGAHDSRPDGRGVRHSCDRETLASRPGSRVPTPLNLRASCLPLGSRSPRRTFAESGPRDVHTLSVRTFEDADLRGSRPAVGARLESANFPWARTACGCEPQRKQNSGNAELARRKPPRQPTLLVGARLAGRGPSRLLISVVRTLRSADLRRREPSRRRGPPGHESSQRRPPRGRTSLVPTSHDASTQCATRGLSSPHHA